VAQLPREGEIALGLTFVGLVVISVHLVLVLAAQEAQKGATPPAEDDDWLADKMVDWSSWLAIFVCVQMPQPVGRVLVEWGLPARARGWAGDGCGIAVGLCLWAGGSHGVASWWDTYCGGCEVEQGVVLCYGQGHWLGPGGEVGGLRYLHGGKGVLSLAGGVGVVRLTMLGGLSRGVVLVSRGGGHGKHTYIPRGEYSNVLSLLLSSGRSGLTGRLVSASGKYTSLPLYQDSSFPLPRLLFNIVSYIDDHFLRIFPSLFSFLSFHFLLI
jgi:hypothetical protein